MAGKQVTELDALPSFTDTSLLPVHNGAGLKKGLLTQLANYLGTKFSNPNLLINPDFRINQRGKSSYTSGYSVDRWKISNATLNDTTKTLSNPNSTGGNLLQFLENNPTGTFTVTLNVVNVTGEVKFLWKDGSTTETSLAISKGLNTYTFTASRLTCVGIQIASGASIQLSYMKLEQGKVATSFVAPNPAEELVKCRRYFLRLPSSLIAYGVNNNLFVSAPEVMNMRNNITVGSIGSGRDNFIRYQGTYKKISVDVPKCEASTMNGYVKIILNPITNEADSRIVSLGFNDFFITLDAEIY